MRKYIIFLSLVACDKKQLDGDSQDTESYMPYCKNIETMLTQDEVSPIGISMDDFLSNVALNYTKALLWDDGTESCLSGTIEPDLSTIRFVESTPVYPEAPSGVAVPSIAVECPDYITFDGYLDLVTPDGILDEELYISFVISEDTLLDENSPINATYTTEIESFNGSFSPAGQFDGITLSGEVGSIYSGEISVLTTESDGNITLAMIEVLAEWGGDPDPECPSFE